jgi:hypothetical protein
MNHPLKTYFSIPVVLATSALVLGASCERIPTKSDYVSAQVTKECRGKTGQALQLCRLVVIKKFKDVPFEDMKRRYPVPELKQRGACSMER